MDGTLLALGPIDRPGSTLIIQLILVAVIIAIAAWLMVKRGTKQLAVRRLLVLAFAVFAVVAVMVPSIVTRLANLVGVGRGADLLLYATVVVLLGMIALQEARAKNEEKRTTHLARRLALDEAPDPVEYRTAALLAPTPGPAPDGATPGSAPVPTTPPQTTPPQTTPPQAAPPITR